MSEVLPKTELTCMVMIEDRKRRKVLVQDRALSWHGLSFPGGHLENGESFTDCAIREMKEETGLNIENPKLCGIVHWYNNKTHDRYLVYLYKTFEFCGELKTECNEGRHFWMDLDELKSQEQPNGFHKYIEVFTNDEVNEIFGSWNDDEQREILYR